MEEQTTQHLPWISEAKPYDGEIDYIKPSREFLAWIEKERQVIYLGTKPFNEKMGELCHMINPHARRWYVRCGLVYFLYDAPIPTGERISYKLIPTGPR